MIPDLLHIEQDLSSLPIFLLEVVVKAVKFARLVLADHATSFVRGDLQFLAMTSFVIK